MLVGTRQAVPAPAARQERFHGHAVTRSEAPTLGRVGSDLVDDADGLVARHERVPQVDHPVELAPVLLDVGAADATGLDPKDRVVAPDAGAGQLDQLERPRASLDDSNDRFGHTRRLARRCAGTARHTPTAGRA